MTIRCHCYVITEDTFAAAVDAHREAIQDMPLNKAAAFVFNKVRNEVRAQGGCDHDRTGKCPKPCLSAVQELINAAEAQAPVSCKGYRTPSGCAAADMLAGLLFEMK